jgi:thymidylate synthase (FAD)
MKVVTPNVRLIASPQLDWQQVNLALNDMLGEETEWYQRNLLAGGPDAEVLIEFGGRACYKSWEPGLNANVTKVRTDAKEYLGNIISSGHGSVLEHANFSFLFSNVSRVFTHEFVRHRAGVAVSQESMRYVRLDDIPFWFPTWALEDKELMVRLVRHIEDAEDLQLWMAEHFKLDDPGVSFHHKKKRTSFMRRFAPGGHATHLLGTINVRAMRHIIAQRTDEGAEEEIRIVVDQMARLAMEAVPNLMQDFAITETNQWHPEHKKV